MTRRLAGGFLVALLGLALAAPPAGAHPGHGRRPAVRPALALPVPPTGAAPAVSPRAASRPTTAPGRGTVIRRYYLANDDHSDYMWTADETAYRDAFLAMLDYYVAQAESTAGDPSDERGRFSVDGTLWFAEYERHRSSVQYDRLVAQARAGNVTVPFNTLVQLYGAMPTEAVVRSFLHAGRLQRRDAIPVSLVVPMENQTLPGGVASLWAGCGAKYSWKGICDCVTRIDAADRPREIYRFTGPDGASVLMKWNSALWGNESIGGYAEARDPGAALDLMQSDPQFLARWPFDVAGAFGYGWDDLQSTTDVFLTTARTRADSVTRVIVSNEVDFFEDFEATHGSEIGSFGASFGNEWDLLTASMGEATAAMKRGVETLRTAEALATIATLFDPSFGDPWSARRDSAMTACGLYYEHSWSPGPGVTEAQRAAWQLDVERRLVDYADGLRDDALARLAGLVPAPMGVERHLVFNPLGRSRSDHADLQVAVAPPLHVIDAATGVEVPSQVLASGSGGTTVRILARLVPAVGYRTYDVLPGAGQSFPPAATISLPTATNARWSVTLDPGGGLASLVDRTHGDVELVDTGAILADLGSGSGSVVVESQGPVSTTLRVTAGGTPPHETRVTLWAEPIGRIDVDGLVTGNFAGEVAYDWPFAPFGGTWRHEEVGMIAQVGRVSAGGDYADENARTDWLSLGHFADLSSGSRGVTLSARDAPFFRVGDSTPTTLDAGSSRVRTVVGMQVDGPGAGISGQFGQDRFESRYALHATSGWDASAAMRFALEHQNPLVSVPVDGGPSAPLPAIAWSLLGVDSDDVLLWALKPAEDGPAAGVVARLWNVADEPRAATLVAAGRPLLAAAAVTHVETHLGPAPIAGGGVLVDCAPQQLRSFRLDLGESTTVGPAPVEGVRLAIAPNPAVVGSACGISFGMPAAGPARVTVHDLRGALVATVVDGPLPAGPQRLAWTPRGIGAGVYFVRVETSRGTEGARVVVLR